MGIKEKTPSEMAGIKFPLKNWKEVIEQPYHVTSRIPITPKSKVDISPKMPIITPKFQRLK
jgi:hypothetical protein